MWSHFWKSKYIKINYIWCISPKKTNFLLQRLFLLPKKNIVLKCNFLHVSLTFFWSVQHMRSTSIIIARGRLSMKWMKLKCQGSSLARSPFQCSGKGLSGFALISCTIEPSNRHRCTQWLCAFQACKTRIYPWRVPDVFKCSFLLRRKACLIQCLKINTSLAPN